MKMYYHATLDAVADAWNALAQGQTTASLLHSYPLTKHWYRCFSNEQSIAVCSIWDTNTCLGIFPLERHRHGGIYSLRSLANFHSSLTEPFIRQGAESVVAGFFFDSVFRCIKDISALKLVNMFSFSPFTQAIATTRPAHSSALLGYREPTYSVDLKPPFEHYYRDFLTTKLRNNFTARLKKMKSNYHLSIDYYRNKEALQHWGEFTSIEDTGWKQEQASSIQQIDDNFKNFYNYFNALAVEKGCLRIFILKLDGIPAAGMYGYIDNDILHIPKTAYHPSFSKYAPSNILFVQTVKHMMEHEPAVRRLHMFPTDFGYKHRYCDTKDTCARVLLTKRSLPGNLIRASYLLKHQVLPRLRDTLRPKHRTETAAP